jgi:hypothetical protein
MVSLGQVQAVPSVIMKPIGATRSAAGPIAAGIITKGIPTAMLRALRGVPVTGAEQRAQFVEMRSFSSVNREEDTMNIFYIIGVVVVVIFVAGYLGVHI